MKFSCDRKNLSSGINIALKAVQPKTTMNILECMVIEANDGSVKLTANDMQLGIETKIPANVERTGSILIKAKKISDIVNRLPDDVVHFEVDENNSILLFCGKAKFNLPGIPADEFPVLPKIEKENVIKISQYALKDMIRQTIISVSDNESNAVLTGELFEVNGDEFKVASLDLIRVSIRKMKLKESYGNVSAIIPGKTLNEISKILPDSEEDLTVSFSRNHVLFEFNDTVVVSRLIEGKFYNIDQLMKNNYETEVAVSRSDLYDCIGRATLLHQESERRPVFMSIRDDEIQIEMSSKDGSMDEELYAEKVGKDIRVAFNPKFMLDILRVIDDEKIKIYLFNPNSPCVIKNENETYIYLFVPINTN